ncbi:MAG TPA: carboxypeptidase-like regulatory domain-containing protein [Polyangiaceae bacterium]
MLGLFCTAAQLSPHLAHAQEASASETAAARSLAIEGLKLAQSGNCTEAAPKLERAEKLYHSAIVASRLGECYVSLGRLVEGTEILRKTLREPQPAEPTAPLTKALERAQRVLDSAKPRIAGLTIKVAAVEQLSVKVDGAVVPGALVDTEIPSDPGEHSVEVSAPGFLRSQARISVGEGEKRTVTLTLTRDPDAALPSPTAPRAAAAGASVSHRPSAPSSVPMPATPPSKPDRTPAFVSLGLGAGAIGAGAFMGSLALGKHKDLERSCPGGVCPPELADDLATAKRLGTFSTIAFGVGGAGVVLGTVLLFTASSSQADHAGSPQKPRTFAGLSRPRAAIGPTSIELGADF